MGGEVDLLGEETKDAIFLRDEPRVDKREEGSQIMVIQMVHPQLGNKELLDGFVDESDVVAFSKGMELRRDFSDSLMASDLKEAVVVPSVKRDWESCSERD